MNKTVIDVITIDQLRELREAGFIVVHQIPLDRMRKAAHRRNEYPEDLGPDQYWHRMAAESIRAQNEEIEAQNKNITTSLPPDPTPSN